MRAFADYFRCPSEFVPFAAPGHSSGAPGFFRFGPETVCFGRCTSNHGTTELEESIKDVENQVYAEDATCQLPFDPDEVVENLRHERYVNGIPKTALGRRLRNAVRNSYQFVRPLIPLSLRKHIHRAYFRGWEEIAFPSWPVDRTVDKIHERLMVHSLKTKAVPAIPFIWFWPGGLPSCAIMTHDVETATGRDSCSRVMDLDDRWSIKSSFQIVPEGRYETPADFLDTIRSRGFEINVHDLNHDGALFTERSEFLRRARQINEHARRFAAQGFRSGILYRNADWFDAFEFSYDMSCPNVGHLEAQRGGCCTVMPFFVGKIVELPLTTTQDYSLFHVLGDYSLDLWKRQIQLILQGHGLVSCIAHPDYLLEERASPVYQGLLAYLSELRDEGKLWIALPREVDRWWRQRSEMRLVRSGESWRIEGAGSDRARIAWACLEGERLVYKFEGNSALPLRSCSAPSAPIQLAS